MRSLLVAALCWSIAAAARAEPPSTYDPVISQALREYRAGNFGEARVLFQQAHRLYPNARTFRGLAITAFELRLYVEAMSEANAALASRERPLTDEQRDEVEATLARARSYAARIEIEVTPADASIEIDGRAAQRSRDGTFLVNPGGHSVAAQADGHAAQMRQVEIESGQRQKLVFQLVSLDANAGAPGGAGSDREGGHVPPGRDDGGAIGPWFWIAAGGAVAFTGAAVALHLAARGEASEIERDCPIEPVRVCTSTELDRRIDDAGIETFNTLTAVGIAAAGVSAAAAVTLLVIELNDGGERRAVSLRVTPAGADVRVRF